MEELTDEEFLAKLSVYLDDAPADSILRQPQILKRLQDMLLTTEMQQNFQAVSMVRAWTRKLAVRLNLDKDLRIKLPQRIDDKLTNQVKASCMGFAELCAALFYKRDVLATAAQTVKELLFVSNSSPSSMIIQNAKKYLSDKEARYPLLQILSIADEVMTDLPIYDPEIYFLYPNIHRELVVRSSLADQKQIKEVISMYEKVKKMNEGLIPVESKYLSFLDPEIISECSNPEEFASHPDPEVRKNFYTNALEKKIDPSTFLSPLIAKGLFDPYVKDLANKILVDNMPKLIPNINPKFVVLIQTAGIAVPNELLTTLNDFDLLKYWCRHLFNRDPAIRTCANNNISALLSQKINIEVDASPDGMVTSFLDALKLPGQVHDVPIAKSFAETIFNLNQPEFVRVASSNKLVPIILDPYSDIKNLLVQFFKLPFEKYHKLLHAVSIRDERFSINDVDRLAELILAFNDKSKDNLIPILARAVFNDISYIESDGANLLRLPRFVQNVFIGPIVGYFDPELYKPNEKIPYESMLLKLINYRQEKKKLYCKNRNICCTTPSVMTDPKVACELLRQIEDDPYSTDVLILSQKPQNLIFNLIVTIQSAKMTTQKCSIICESLFEKSPELAFKLAQTIVEYGGDVKFPPNIDDYIYDGATQRSCLSFLVTYLNFKKKVEIDYTRLETLVDSSTPVNILRQVSALLSVRPRSIIGNKLIEQKDAVIKANGFRCATICEELKEMASKLALCDQQAVCVRAAAVEYICEYLRRRPENFQLSILFNEIHGWTPLSFALLKLLHIPGIREQLPHFEQFINGYLVKDFPIFAVAAIYALKGYEISLDTTIQALTDLINISELTDCILNIMTTFSEETLRKFSPEMIFCITDALSDNIDIKLALVIVNNLLCAGVEFPDQSMEHLIALYRKCIENKCSIEYLHTVLTQAFQVSKSSKSVALSMKFDKLIIKELKNSMGQHGDTVFMTVSMYIINYHKAQNRLVNSWKLEFIHEIFDTSYAVINFLLSLVKRNDETSSKFLVPVDGVTLLDRVTDSLDSGNPLVLELFANLLNCHKVRNKVLLRKSVIPTFVSYVQEYSYDRRSKSLLEGWLRVFITISLHLDSLDKLYGSGKVSDLLLSFFYSGDEIRQNRMFIIFLGNLIRSKAHREGLKAIVAQECSKNEEYHLIEVFNSLIEDANKL